MRLLAAAVLAAFLSSPAVAGGSCTPLALAVERIKGAGNTIVGLDPIPHSRASLLLWVNSDGDLVGNLVGGAAQTGEPCVVDKGLLALGAAIDMPAGTPAPEAAPKPAAAPGRELGI